MPRQVGIQNSIVDYITIFKKNVYLDYPECSGVIAYNINIVKLRELINGTTDQTIILADKKNGDILFCNNNMTLFNKTIKDLPY